MKLTRQVKRQGLTLVEMIVTVGLLTGVIGAGMRAVVTARHMSERDAAMTQLYAAAQTEIARLCATDWAALAEGERALTAEEMTALGLKTAPGLACSVAVRAVPSLELREIRVHLERTTASGLAQAELATWRGKGMP